MKNMKNISATLLVWVTVAALTTLPLLAQSSKSSQHRSDVNRVKNATVCNPCNVTNSITGTVTAAFAATPTNLSGVTVKLYGPIANNLRTVTLTPLVNTVTTNGSGVYTFTPVTNTTTASNHYVLTFEKAGFISSSMNATVSVNSGTNTVNTVGLLPALQLNAVCATTGNYSWRLRNGNGATYNYNYGLLRGSASGSGTIGSSDVYITVPKTSAGLGILQVLVGGYSVASAQAQNLNCPTASVTGKVTDSATTNPLNGATVTVKDVNNNTVGTGTTNSSGIYTIPGISINSQVNTNPYSVAFSAAGYNNSSASVTLGGGQTVTQNAQLTASGAAGAVNIDLDQLTIQDVYLLQPTFINTICFTPPFSFSPCQIPGPPICTFIISNPIADQPITSATVVIFDSNNNSVGQLTSTPTTSGQYGVFSFTNLPVGTYHYTVNGSPGGGTLSVTAGQTTVSIFHLPSIHVHAPPGC